MASRAGKQDCVREGNRADVAKVPLRRLNGALADEGLDRSPPVLFSGKQPCSETAYFASLSKPTFLRGAKIGASSAFCEASYETGGADILSPSVGCDIVNLCTRDI